MVGVLQTSFSKHNDNKRFLERLEINYQHVKDKILAEEAHDERIDINKNADKLKCSLDKKKYYIPEFEVPESIDSSDSDYDSDDDSDDYDSEDNSPENDESEEVSRRKKRSKKSRRNRRK